MTVMGDGLWDVKSDTDFDHLFFPQSSSDSFGAYDTNEPSSTFVDPSLTSFTPPPGELPQPDDILPGIPSRPCSPFGHPQPYSVPASPHTVMEDFTLSSPLPTPQPFIRHAYSQPPEEIMFSRPGTPFDMEPPPGPPLPPMQPQFTRHGHPIDVTQPPPLGPLRPGPVRMTKRAATAKTPRRHPYPAATRQKDRKGKNAMLPRSMPVPFPPLQHVPPMPGKRMVPMSTPRMVQSPRPPMIPLGPQNGGRLGTPIVIEGGMEGLSRGAPDGGWLRAVGEQVDRVDREFEELKRMLSGVNRAAVGEQKSQDRRVAIEDIKCGREELKRMFSGVNRNAVGEEKSQDRQEEKEKLKRGLKVQTQFGEAHENGSWSVAAIAQEHEDLFGKEDLPDTGGVTMKEEGQQNAVEGAHADHDIFQEEELKG